MSKNKTMHQPKRDMPLPENAVRAPRENTARALTPAEAHARRSLMAIAFAEAEAAKNGK